MIFARKFWCQRFDSTSKFSLDVDSNSKFQQFLLQVKRTLWKHKKITSKFWHRLTLNWCKKLTAAGKVLYSKLTHVLHYDNLWEISSEIGSQFNSVLSLLIQRENTQLLNHVLLHENAHEDQSCTLFYCHLDLNHSFCKTAAHVSTGVAWSHGFYWHNFTWVVGHHEMLPTMTLTIISDMVEYFLFATSFLDELMCFTKGVWSLTVIAPSLSCTCIIHHICSAVASVLTVSVYKA